MGADDPTQLLREALDSDTTSESVFELAERLRDRGMTQEDLKKLYADELNLHRESADERKWDALADTLDFIVGWCSPGKALYRDDER